MQSSFSNQVINGQLRQVQILNYSNGITSRRVFENPGDAIPMEVTWVKTSEVRVKKEDVIEHREVQLYNHYFKSLH